ncbi:cytochrome P450 6j1-like [Solenopsis invicta]|uniref:cytochrome P450 6j1-like n=1 Tax=Solenopsis invicta TaxID=13686 RepID=UPI00193E2BE4|nr:cytochrome P450 6j1-like [Solenopsis invicta]
MGSLYKMSCLDNSCLSQGIAGTRHRIHLRLSDSGAGVTPLTFRRYVFKMILEELIGAFIIILSIVYIYYKYVIFNFWHKKGVFYIKPIVPIGNILPLVTGKTQVGVFFQDAYQKYKEHRCFGMYAFFKQNLVITDLDLMRTVLSKGIQ